VDERNEWSPMHIKTVYTYGADLARKFQKTQKYNLSDEVHTARRQYIQKHTVDARTAKINTSSSLCCLPHSGLRSLLYQSAIVRFRKLHYRSRQQIYSLRPEMAHGRDIRLLDIATYSEESRASRSSSNI